MSLTCLSQMGEIDKVRCSHALTDLYTLYKSVYTYVHTYVDSYVCVLYIYMLHTTNILQKRQGSNSLRHGED